MAAIATFALKAGVWFRRGRLVIVSPDSLGTTCQLSGRNSTYRSVQISGTGSGLLLRPEFRVRLPDVPVWADALCHGSATDHRLAQTAVGECPGCRSRQPSSRNE